MKSSINVNNRLSENHDNIIPFINSFKFKANKFIQRTEEYTLQGLNPGGIYQAIWCRDVAYILQSWYYSGNIHGVLQQLYYIWSHQISHNGEKIIYGRGSPERNYHAVIARPKKQNTFEGFLPTTIFNAGYCEVYGLHPDIDSTVLMINTTSWILTKLLINSPIQENNIIGSNQNISTSNLMSKHSRVIDFVLPRMLKAVDCILTRDIDNDGLLEQNYNEDWMDTCLRTGKIVYNQACCILALKNLFCLLSIMNRNSEAMRMQKLFRRTINAVEEKLWSEKDGCYIDVQDSNHTIDNNKVITQDVLLYLVAVTENPVSDSLSVQRNNIQNSKIKNKINNINYNQNIIEKIKQQKKDLGLTFERGNRTLNAIRDKVWMNEWPVNIEKILNFTAPWFLKPYFYHNRTFWPWISGIEMLARGRFNRFGENNLILSKLLLEDDVNLLAFYEWVNPNTQKGSGAYPFRTGICCVRTAIEDIINSI